VKSGLSVLRQWPRANRLKATEAWRGSVNDYWTDLFTAKEEGRKVVWYNGTHMPPFFQAHDLAWVHGEACVGLISPPSMVSCPRRRPARIAAMIANSAPTPNPSRTGADQHPRRQGRQDRSLDPDDPRR